MARGKIYGHLVVLDSSQLMLLQAELQSRSYLLHGFKLVSSDLTLTLGLGPTRQDRLVLDSTRSAHQSFKETDGIMFCGLVVLACLSSQFAEFESVVGALVSLLLLG